MELSDRREPRGRGGRRYGGRRGRARRSEADRRLGDRAASSERETSVERRGRHSGVHESKRSVLHIQIEENTILRTWSSRE